MTKQSVSPENYCAILNCIAGAKEMSDAAFREFVLQTLPVVDYEETEPAWREVEEQRAVEIDPP